MFTLRIIPQSMGKLGVYLLTPNPIDWKSFLEHERPGPCKCPMHGAQHPLVIRRMLGQRELQLFWGKGHMTFANILEKLQMTDGQRISKGLMQIHSIPSHDCSISYLG